MEKMRREVKKTVRKKGENVKDKYRTLFGGL